MNELHLEKRIRDESWDYRGVNTKYSVHGLHSYPAMMIPQIAKRLIENYSNSNETILDPYCGSGTSLTESLIHGINAYGVDINPLAVLISKVKTTLINKKKLNTAFTNLQEPLQKYRWDPKKIPKYEKPDYFNVDFWFKDNVIQHLQLIKEAISEFEDREIKDFFNIALSETIRKVSNTRNGEYKLFRIPEAKLNTWNPDVIPTFLEICNRNVNSMNELRKHIQENKVKKAKIKITQEDMTKKTSIPKNSVSSIITSPPYGDSKTTVAYGQFSRLALQWLDYNYDEIKQIDKVCLGGKPPNTLSFGLPSHTLNEILEQISANDEKRALDVFAFYLDFNTTLDELERIAKENLSICMVVGNRTVTGINIPTDVIFAELFSHRGFKHNKTIVRAIPTKRLPKRSSPSNIKGESVSTMNSEYILILER